MSNTARLIKMAKTIKKHEGRIYIETIGIFILFLLTVLCFVLAGFGFMLPDNFVIPLLTNLLLIFLIAEGIIIIMLLYRISQK